MRRGSEEGADERAEGPEGVDWQAAIARHDRRVVVSLLALDVGIEQAKELAQETWLILVEKHRRGDLAEVKLPGLALRQARFLALEARRGRARDASVAVDHLPEVHDDRQRVEETVAGRRDLARLEQALRDCGPRAREVFRLVYGPGAPSHAEAADALGMSVQRLRQTLCEIRKRMRLALQDDHG